DGATSEAAIALASNLSRLASRQDEAAGELLEIPPDSRNHPRNVPEVQEALATLGQSVGLQAKIVGLMEEVVERTVHSRLDARKAARATQKERVGCLAESLAEDVKLIAARHQHAASRMEGALNPATAQHVAHDIRGITLVQEQLSYQVQQFIASVEGAVFNTTGETITKRSAANVHDGFGNELEATTAADAADAQKNKTTVAEGEARTESGRDREAETAQKLIGRLATAVIQELRKGVDVGTVAAARAQAIRRGSQAGRLADELRQIASVQVAAALALSEVGAKLVAEALAEKPFPREYALPSRAPGHARGGSGAQYATNREHGMNDAIGNGVRETESLRATAVVGGHQGDGFAAVIIAPEAGVSIECAGLDDGGIPEALGLDPLPVASSVNPVAASIAIEDAAREEEKAAATRIQSFLRRCRRQGRSGAVGAPPKEGATTTPDTLSKLVAVTELSSGENSSIVSNLDWFGSALHFLRREVDIFLHDQEVPDGVPEKNDPVMANGTPSLVFSCDNKHTLEIGGGSTAVGSASDNDVGGVDDDVEDPGRDDHEETKTDLSEEDEIDWPTLPPLPLRARAPSLYTLPLPGAGFQTKQVLGSGEGLREEVKASSQSQRFGVGRGIFTKLDHEVAARLSAATSIFSLRAADVLTAFSPPTTKTTSSSCLVNAPTLVPDDELPRGSPFPVLGTIGRCLNSLSVRRSCANVSSPEALRRRLRAEAEDASHAGLGRPWLLSSRKTCVPTRHKLEQQQRSAFLRRENARAAHGHAGKSRFKKFRQHRRRADFFGSWTPLGRRLARRFNAGRAAQRRCILGETDAFRARQVGRQLRSGASLDALEKLERALDLRLSVSREKRIAPAHVSELLDVVGRYVFSDSQLCEQPPEMTSDPSGMAKNDVDPERSRCLICQELLEDLRQKFPVVGDQSSWMDDTDPFCCDRCWRNSPRSDSPGGPKSTAPPPPTDKGKHGVGRAAAGDDACIGGSSHHSVFLGREWIEETPVLSVIDGSDSGMRNAGGGNRNDTSYGASSSKQSDALRNSPRIPLPTDFSPGLFNEGAGAMEPPQGVKTMMPAEEAGMALSASEGSVPERQGRQARAQPPTTKLEAVAAAFSAHLHGVDKHPLELARLCRFAQFLTENELLREAYEVILHVVSSFAVAINAPCSSSSRFLPSLPLPSGLRGQLLLVAGRLAVATGRYPEAVKHVKAAVRTVTEDSVTNNSNIPSRESPAILVSSSRMFEYLLDDRSAEVLLLGCLMRYPDYKPALLSYGILAARTGQLAVAERYLTRATAVLSRRGTMGKAGGEQAKGFGVEIGPAEDWVALMKLYSERWPPSARAADAL
ncbi:unnamed protein product, partial [Hapterophycus canaliculatus]